MAQFRRRSLMRLISEGENPGIWLKNVRLSIILLFAC